jgi:hypothetical protein
VKPEVHRVVWDSRLCEVVDKINALDKPDKDELLNRLVAIVGSSTAKLISARAALKELDALSPAPEPPSVVSDESSSSRKRARQ